MRQIGVFLVAVGALVGAGCASAPPSAPPSVDVTGKWQGTWQFEQVALGGGQVIMDLKQSGAEVTGDVVVTGPAMNRPTTMQATVSGNQLILKGAGSRHPDRHGKYDERGRVRGGRSEPHPEAPVGAVPGHPNAGSGGESVLALRRALAG